MRQRVLHFQLFLLLFLVSDATVSEAGMENLEELLPIMFRRARLQAQRQRVLLDGLEHGCHLLVVPVSLLHLVALVRDAASQLGLASAEVGEELIELRLRRLLHLHNSLLPKLLVLLE